MKIANTTLHRTFVSLLVIASTNSFANDPGGVFTLSLENDLFGSGSDRYYTSGFQFSYISDTYHPQWANRLVNVLPFYNRSDNPRFGIALGQAIFTPKDITQSALITDDRPYAGWLYTTVSLASDGRTFGDGLIKNIAFANTLDITFGIIGPSSGAQQTQETVHQWVDTTQPEGWENQLRDEPGFILAYNRLWQYPLSEHIDITTQLGASVGNIYTFINSGLTFRFGNSLAKDFGPPLIRPSIVGSNHFVPKKQLEWYTFLGLGGRYVDRNIFLDGNTEKDSHKINKKNWVGDAQLGVVLNFGRAQVGLVQIFRSKEFDLQKENNHYGAITFGWRYY